VGEPVTLKRWRGEVVGVEVMGGAQWFLPEAGSALAFRLHLAFLGLGVLLWGLLLGWWDGPFMLAFRVFAWMFMSIVPVALAVGALAGGVEPGPAFVAQVAFGVFAVGVAGAMLVGSLDSW
jgi:hypothetical protein